jgi:hypothetical protein
MSPYLTVAELAELLRRSPLTIRRRCQRGFYQGAWKDAGQWRIPREEALPAPATPKRSAPTERAQIIRKIIARLT